MLKIGDFFCCQKPVSICYATIMKSKPRKEQNAGITRVNRPEVIAHPPANEFCNAVTGQMITFMTRRGKFLIIHLQNESKIILHLRMTGCLPVTPPDYPQEKHTHVIMQCNNGMEPLSSDCNAKYLQDRLAKRKKAIKMCLLDQSVIAGIGNIYSDEILFRARIYPSAPANSLTSQEWERLAMVIPECLCYFIEKNRITKDDYLRTRGQNYRNTPFLQVYGREGGPCPCCGEPLVRMVIGGRSSVHCPVCQKC